MKRIYLLILFNGMLIIYSCNSGEKNQSIQPANLVVNKDTIKVGFLELIPTDEVIQNEISSRCSKYGVSSNVKIIGKYKITENKYLIYVKRNDYIIPSELICLENGTWLLDMANLSMGDSFIIIDKK